MEMEPRRYESYDILLSPEAKPPEWFTKEELDAAEALIMLYEESHGRGSRRRRRRSTFSAASAKRVKMSTSNSAASSLVEEAKNSTSAAADQQSSPNPNPPLQLTAYNGDDSFQSQVIVVRCVNLQTTTGLYDGEPKKSASSAAESTHAINGDAVAVNNQEVLSPTPVLTASNGGYICTICGRVFQSHQALGGHKTLHWAKPRKGAVSDDGGPRNSAAIDGGVHECPVCHERFQCGQALGGHMRKHYGGPTLLRNKKTAKPAITLLDLNLPPAPEE